jgi:hypothetical protein
VGHYEAGELAGLACGCEEPSSEDDAVVGFELDVFTRHFDDFDWYYGYIMGMDKGEAELLVDSIVVLSIL